jgi:hypothetical protein
MHRSTRGAIAAGSLALMLVTSPAASAPSPKDDPSVSGPLELERHDCEPPVKSQADNGEVGVVTQKCLWLYQYDPDKESNANKDFGIAWVQTSFSPRNGWCLQQAESGILNYDKKILKKTPNRGYRTGKKHSGTAKLTSTAGGDGSGPATIKKSFPRMPGRVSVGMEQGGRYFKTVWEGATQQTVVFAIGIEVWWDPAMASSPNAGGALQSKLRQRC